MIPIYITAVNRFFYLDRCLDSLKKFGSNFGKVRILGGDTYHDKYYEKLKIKHPTIEIVTTNNELRDYWIGEVDLSKDKYLCFLQDDTWFIDYVDFGLVEERMEKYDLPLVKLIYGPEFRDGCEFRKFDYIEIYKPKFENDNMYQAWLYCMMIFRKDYWMTSFKAGPNVMDEQPMIRAAKEYILSGNFNAGRMVKRCMCQGWAVGTRNDPTCRYNALPHANFAEVLNKLWFDDKFNILENFPLDFSVEYIEKCFRENGIEEKIIKNWKEWRLDLKDRTEFLI